VIIKAFDPGITTGYAKFDAQSNDYEVGEFDAKDLRIVYRLCWNGKPDIIGYEDFKHRPTLIKTEMFSLQVIGVIRYYCQNTETPEFSFLPAQAKAFWTDNKLKSLSLWTKGMPHGMDALRVLLTYRQSTDPAWFNLTVKELR
jgi:hypothetical protein